MTTGETPILPRAVLVLIISLMSLIFIPAGCDQIIGTSEGALAEYFRDPEFIPPSVNGTYGGETRCVVSSQNNVVFNCSARHPVRWVTPPGLANRTVFTTETAHPPSSNLYVSVIQIKNFSLTDNSTILRCVMRNGHRELDTSVKLDVQGSSAPSDSSVYAVSSSISRMITISNMAFSFWVRLRRRPSFKADLKARWYRKFQSQTVDVRGGETEKLIEFTGSMWSSVRPAPPGERFMPQWTSSSEDLVTEVDFNPPVRVRSGNYTVRVIDRAGTILFSKNFELIVVSAVRVQEVEIYPYDPSSNASTTNFDSVLLEKSMDPIMTVEINRTYIIVCQFSGNPFSPERAFMIKHKLNCPPISIDSNDTSVVLKPSGSELSDAARGCHDYNGLGIVDMLPVRYGDDGIIMSALVTFLDTMHYGCLYNHTTKMDFNDRIIAVTDMLHAGAKTGIGAMTLQPRPDDIIVGDNVTLRCMVNALRYYHLFWKINSTFITFGDDPGPGYQTVFSTTSGSKICDLIISNISIDQSGTYTCRTHRSSWNYMVKTDVEVQVKVQTPQAPFFGPATTSRQVFKVTRSYDSLELICDPRGVPRPTVAWYKLCEVDDCNETSALLTEGSRAANISLHDTKNSGLYECVIVNRVGAIKRQFQVIISEPVQGRPIALIVCLVVIAVVSVGLAILVVRYYVKSRKTKPLRDLKAELRSQAKVESFKLELDAQVPTNEQIHALPFDFRYEISEEKLSLTDRLLGTGTYGQVSLGYLKLDDGRQLPVAVKTPRNHMDLHQLRILLSEMKLMMHLGSHVNVLSLLGVISAQLDRGALFEILEYCELGSLRQYLRQYGKRSCAPDESTSNPPPTQDATESSSGIPDSISAGYVRPFELIENEHPSPMDLLAYCYQIAAGMSFLSSNNVMHRDLALRNILLTASRIVKIADFGLAFQDAQKTGSSGDEEAYLPLKWMAPEAIEFGKCTTEGDVWSYGIVIWEIFTFGAIPYPDHEDFNDLLAWLKQGNRMSLPDDCPKELAHIVATCWSEQPSERPTFYQCQKSIAQLGNSLSAVYWAQVLRMIDIMSDDMVKPTYYNINQAVSLKRKLGTNC